MKNSNHSSGNPTLQDKTDSSPKSKEDLFLDRYHLTPSEIESLRKHKKEISLQARGKFKHLFTDKEAKEPGNDK